MAKRKADDVVVPGVEEPPDRTRQARTVVDDATPATDGGAVVDALSALRRYFPRHQGFKPGQERVITALLSGENNAAAIFPTGGGKSLCYLLPGLALHEANAGMTLVISPLLALMKDQVDAARQLNHPADMLASSLSLEEKIEVARRVQDGETAVLYMAPEQLNNERSLALIRQVKIAMIAIDEAHCISEWGNSFRPDYLRLAKLCADWKVPRVVALTATATPRVANDICQAFRVDGQNCVRTSFFRSNLKFQFVAVEQSNRDAVLIRSIQRLAPGDIIVYCTLQKTTQEVADRLNRIPGFEARPYHAGLDTETRKGTQDWYMTKSSPSAAATKYRLVVATIAFGMGVDKQDIRAIIHYNLPKSLESYSQEIGRAGRDGKDSQCVMLACVEDVPQLEAFSYCDSPSLRSVEGTLNDLFGNYAVGSERALSHFSIGRSNDMTEQTVKMLLAFVDVYHGYIRQGTPRYAVYKVRARDGRPVSQVAGMLRQREFDIAPNVTQALLRFWTPKSTWIHIDVGAAAKNTNVTRESMVQALSRLEQARALEVVPSQVENVYHILQRPASVKELARVEYERFQAREKQDLARIGQVLSFLTSDECHAKLLTEYFEGPSGPSSSTSAEPIFPCGECPHCKATEPFQLLRREESKLDPGLWEKLANDSRLPKDDPQLIARVAMGYKSPRISQLRLDKLDTFGLLAGQASYETVMHRIMQRFFPNGA